MNTSFYIAKRFFKQQGNKSAITGPIVKLIVISIALSVAIVQIAFAVFFGFKKEIRHKLSEFNGHIQISSLNNNHSFEETPIEISGDFMDKIGAENQVIHVQTTAQKLGIARANQLNYAIILKGVDPNFDWAIVKDNLLEGKIIEVNDSARTRDILISKYIAEKLSLKIGDKLLMTFFDQSKSILASMRYGSYKIAGIYETGMEIFDKQYAYADLKEIQRLYNWSNEQSGKVEVKLDQFGFIEKVKNNLENLLFEFITDEMEYYQVASVTEQYPLIFGWIDLFDKNLLVLLGIITLIAGINLTSGLLILILEHVRNIGILKSLGMTSSAVVRIFFYTGAIFALRGLIIGNIIGIGLCYLQQLFEPITLNKTYYFLDVVPIHLSFLSWFLINIITFMVILLLLIIPSSFVAKIKPAESIRFS